MSAVCREDSFLLKQGQCDLHASSNRPVPVLTVFTGSVLVPQEPQACRDLSTLLMHAEPDQP